jgi:4-alpha-glucanotransferase
MSAGSFLTTIAEKLGIVSSYWDIQGNINFTTDEVRQKILLALGVDLSDLNSSLSEIEDKKWLQVVSPISVFRGELGSLWIDVFIPSDIRELCWRFITEEAFELSGKIEFAFHAACEVRELSGINFGRFSFDLSAAIKEKIPNLQLGYHRLEFSFDNKKYESLVIFAPKECYLPESIERGEKLWGVSAQLYGLGSNNNFGIGDFLDLKQLSEEVKKGGGNAIGLNPLHALGTCVDLEYSPYSPSSRQALEPFYLSTDWARELLGLEVKKKFSPEKNKSRYVDYVTNLPLKWTEIRDIYEEFKIKNEISDLDKFNEYRENITKSKFLYAVFCAIQETEKTKNPSCWGWPKWQAELQYVNSPKVQDFIANNLESINFYLFVQWLLELQLKHVSQVCRSSGLEVGLYLDFALGARYGGADSWIYRDLYAENVSMGAPPDELAPQGQDWGLPPFIPEKLREACYAPFIEALRFNMQFAGAIRIDHVMSLMRLFWVCRSGEQKMQGAYVLYRLDELMAIVALESLRNKCLVIGEDLGTVPDEVRSEMSASKVFSYKVLIFMKDSQGNFISPQDYPEKSLVVASTHDLPTLKSYWSLFDLDVREKLNLHSPEVLKNLKKSRTEDVRKLSQLLFEKDSEEHSCDLLLGMVIKFLFRAKSQFMMVQLEDLVGQSEQVNLPGTVFEHRNWQTRVALDEAIKAIQQIPYLCQQKPG